MKVLQKDLVLLPYPYTNMKDKKVRPALVVSNDRLNNISKDCVLIPISSVLKNDDYSYILNSEDLCEGRLIKKSRVKVNKLFCLKTDLIIMKIGRLKEDIFDQVKKRILKVF